MKLSAYYQLALRDQSVPEFAKQAIASNLARLQASGSDVEVNRYLADVCEARREEALAAKWATAYEKGGYSGSLITKATGYAKSDVSIPAYPGFSIDYDQAADMVADMVMPVVPGDISRKFFKFQRRDKSRGMNLLIGANGQIPEGSMDVATATYNEKAYGEKVRIDLNSLAQQSPGLDLMTHHSRTLMGDLMMQREVRVANIVMGASNYASGCTFALAGLNRWDVGPATSTANPITDIKITALASASLAVAPNAMVASKPVLAYLRTHPKVIAAAGTTAGARVISYQELANLFDLDYVIEGRAKIDSAGTTATASYGFVWGKGCALLRIKPGVSPFELSFAKTFRHTPMLFRDEYDGVTGVRGTNYLIGTHEDAELVVASDAGVLIDTVIS